MCEQLNYSANLVSTIPEIGSGRMEYKAANCLGRLSKSFIKSVILGTELKSKYTFSAKKGQRIWAKCLTRFCVLSTKWPFSVAKDWVITCGEKSPSLQTIAGTFGQELKRRGRE